MTPPSDYDSPWKEVLERFLPDFVAFFLPQAHAAIDWARGYAFLDKELQQIAPAAALGRRLVDALVQVWRHDGDEAWVLIHIEVQGQEEPEFARRMFGYYYRLLDRFDRPVASLAVLTDERAGWRPDQYRATLWGCTVEFRFPVVKLLDYRARRADLEASRNPFALVVLAHLTTQETRGDAARRGQAKLALVRRLYDLGYERETIIGLFRFIDWLLRLPDALEAQFWQALRQYEEARRMPYITSVEQIGIQKGLEQGREQGREQGLEQGREQGLRQGLLIGLEQILALKFGADGGRLFEELRPIDDVAVLQAVADRLKTATTLNEVRRSYLPADDE